MLEGAAEGETHKYTHASVKVVNRAGALPHAAPARAVDNNEFAAAMEPPETLPATIEDQGDSLAAVFGTDSF